MQLVQFGILCQLALLLMAGCTSEIGFDANDHEPIVGGPSEGGEAVFQGLPDELESTARIGPKGEPGELMTIAGQVFDSKGEPAVGAIVYAYHTNSDGIYPPNSDFAGLAAERHGTLRGWAKTDEDGRYRFETIRPSGYPESKLPQHVHMHIIEPSRCTYFIDSVLLTDDPRLTAELRATEDTQRGGSGVVTPRRVDQAWIVERDIVLGKNIPEYPQE